MKSDREWVRVREWESESEGKCRYNKKIWKLKEIKRNVNY